MCSAPGEPEHDSRTRWSSRGVDVHFLDLRASSLGRREPPQLEKLLRLQPPRLPGGAAYDVKLVLTHVISRSGVGSSAGDNGKSYRLGHRAMFLQGAASSRVRSEVEVRGLGDTTGFRSSGGDDSAVGDSSRRSPHCRPGSKKEGTTGARSRPTSAEGSSAKHERVGGSSPVIPQRPPSQRLACLESGRALVPGTGSWLMRRRKPKVRNEQSSGSGCETFLTSAKQGETEPPTTDALSLENLVDYVQKIQRQDPR